MQLNKDNYFSKEADREYMSITQFKDFDHEHGGCESAALASLNGEWTEKENSSFLIGSYIHAWSEGEEAFKKFIKDNYACIYKKNGDLYADFAKADKMIETLKRDKLIEDFRVGDKEVILTADLFGVKWKAMFDILNHENRFLIDLKTTKSIHEKYWNERRKTKENFIEFYDYTLQLAVYLEILRLNLDKADYYDSYIIVVDKQDIPDKAILYLGNSFIHEKLEEVENKIGHIVDVKNGKVEPKRCENCDYCRSTKQLKEIIYYKEI